MKTELILYKQQLAENENFDLIPEYGWEFTGTDGVDWLKEDRKIVKVTGVSRTLSQTGVLLPGVTYRVRFNVSGRTTSTASFKCSLSGTNHVVIGTNAIFDTTFVADGTDIIFETTSTFDGAFSKFSITGYPDIYNIDLREDVNVPLNFSIDNIFDVSKRKTTFSKTIKIPGTKNNNIAFGKVYKINSEDLYVPTKLSRCSILNSGITVFDGSLSIDSISKVIEKGIEQIEYDITVYGNLVDIFDKLGNKTIKDLDFSRWDHTFEIYSILSSSGAAYTINGLPQIYDQSVANYIDNQALVYGKAANSIGSVVYEGNTVVDINFSTSHSFNDGDIVTIQSDNNLICGEHKVLRVVGNNIYISMLYANLTSTSFTNLDVEKRTWNSQGYIYPMVDNGSWMRECVNGDIAPSNSNTAGQLTAGKIYTIKFFAGDDFTNLAKDPFTGSPVTPAAGVTFVADDGIAIVNNPVSANSWISGSILLTHDLEANGAKLYYKKLFANHWHPTDFIPYIFVKEVWDKMMQLINYYYTSTELSGDLFTRFIMPVDQSFNIYEYIGLYSPGPLPTDAQTVYMNDWLPQLSLKDFMISILNLYNLVIIPDKEFPNRIELVCRADFYNSTQIELEPDAEQPIEVKLSNSFLPKGYHLKYKECDDFFNKDYKIDFGNISNANGIVNPVNRSYGDYYVSTGNERAKDDNVTELSFVPTVLAGNLDGIYDTFNPGQGQDKVISVGFSADQFGENARRDVLNRLLIVGLRGTDYKWSMTASIAAAPNETFNVANAYGGYWFPYAGHLLSVYDAVPTYDLNFGTLLGQYFPQTYTASDWQKKTMQSLYWGKYLLDITNVNGRVITGTFRFSIMDIYNLDFRNTYKLTNYTLKLNRITDWNVNGDGFAKAEFTLKNL